MSQPHTPCPIVMGSPQLQPEAEYNCPSCGLHMHRYEDGLDISTPLYLLVDSRTASASEILASSLQDNGRAKLIGCSGPRTFGKAVIQTVNHTPATAITYSSPSSLPLTLCVHSVEPRFRPYLMGRGSSSRRHATKHLSALTSTSRELKWTFKRTVRLRLKLQSAFPQSCPSIAAVVHFSHAMNGVSKCESRNCRIGSDCRIFRALDGLVLHCDVSSIPN
mmetsp:Transcript_19170/g.52793  ORF Transcript_19170/g.52793 Transcript_19170/m.52793 type:complete len:220 (+) Transcript_19170:194-853(+)